MPPAVLITGAARRIGKVLARRFAGAGWHVVIHHGFSHDDAAALATSLPSAEVVQCDLTDPAAAEAMVENLAKRLPDWRCLINNAAVFNEDSVDRTDPAVLAEAIAVNLASPVRMAQAFLRSAQSQGGRRVIHFTDMKVENPNPDFFSYTLAKNALAASVKTLAMGPWRPSDRVYGLAPGAMLPSHDQLDEEHELSGRMNLLQRLTDPLELAEAALFLSQGWLESGQSLFIDSGQHLLSQPRDVLYLARGLS